MPIELGSAFTVYAKKQTLKNVTDYIVDVICKRAVLGFNYGVILIPEGLIYFIQEVQKLIAELNEILAHDVVDEGGLWKNKFAEQYKELFEFFASSNSRTKKIHMEMFRLPKLRPKKGSSKWRKRSWRSESRRVLIRHSSWGNLSFLFVKKDAVCQSSLMLIIAMRWVMVLQLYFNQGKLG